MSSLMLKILLHYYHTPALYPSADYDIAIVDAHAMLVDAKLIDRSRYGICTISELGKQHVDTLVSVALPTVHV